MSVNVVHCWSHLIKLDNRCTETSTLGVFQKIKNMRLFTVDILGDTAWVYVQAACFYLWGDI